MISCDPIVSHEEIPLLNCTNLRKNHADQWWSESARIIIEHVCHCADRLVRRQHTGGSLHDGGRYTMWNGNEHQCEGMLYEHCIKRSSVCF